MDASQLLEEYRIAVDEFELNIATKAGASLDMNLEILYHKTTDPIVHGQMQKIYNSRIDLSFISNDWLDKDFSVSKALSMLNNYKIDGMFRENIWLTKANHLFTKLINYNGVYSVDVSQIKELEMKFPLKFIGDLTRADLFKTLWIIGYAVTRQQNASEHEQTGIIECYEIFEYPTSCIYVKTAINFLRLVKLLENKRFKNLNCGYLVEAFKILERNRVLANLEIQEFTANSIEESHKTIQSIVNPYGLNFDNEKLLAASVAIEKALILNQAPPADLISLVGKFKNNNPQEFAYFEKVSKMILQYYDPKTKTIISGNEAPIDVLQNVFSRQNL